MFNFIVKNIPTQFVKLGDAEVNADYVYGLLEEFSVDDNINDYDLNIPTKIIDACIKEGILYSHTGSRMAKLYSKTDKFEEFYNIYTNEYLEYKENEEK